MTEKRGRNQMAIYSKDFAICPWCHAKTDSTVSHLYGGAPREFGPWHCDACGKWYSGVVRGRGSITIAKDDCREVFMRSMVLLKFDGKDGSVFFVMDHKRYCAASGETDEEIQNHQRYFFEEHSCPTNWIDSCAAVIQGGDADPHGFLTFVRSVDVARDLDATDDAIWQELFPEAFGDGPIIDGEARQMVRRIAPS